MICVLCEAARTKGIPIGFYMTTCPTCSERLIASRPEYAESKRRGSLTPQYTNQLLKITDPDETIEAAHERVKQWDKQQ